MTIRCPQYIAEGKRILVTLRPLGNTGLQISPLVLGGGVFGANGMDKERSFAVLDAYVAAGGTIIDTADIYAAYLPDHEGGESERMIGAWLAHRGRRDDVQIVTKVGAPFGDIPASLSADYIAASIDKSLARLGTDYVDVYMAHVDDANTPQEETAEAFDKIIKAGKARHLGASNLSPDRLKSALAISDANGLARYAVFQPAYNLMERGFETVYRDLCASENIGVITYFALAQGYLTGKYRISHDLSKSVRGSDMLAFGGQVRSYLEGKGPSVLAVMDDIAEQHRTNVAAVALAWIMAKPGVAAPIASATRIEQLEQILPSMTLNLSADEMSLLDAATE